MEGKSKKEIVLLKARERQTRRDLQKGYYSPAILSKRLKIEFSLVGKNIKETLEQIISHKIEGKCIEEGFVRPNSIKILTYSSGIVSGKFILFEVVFECLVCTTVEGMIIRCIAKNISTAGIRAITNEDISPIVVTVLRDHHYNMPYFSTIKEGDEIIVRVIGQRFELYDKFVSVIGELITPGTKLPKVKMPTIKEITPKEEVKEEPIQKIEEVYKKPKETSKIFLSSNVKNVPTLPNFKETTYNRGDETYSRWEDINNPEVSLLNRPLAEGPRRYKDGYGRIFSSYTVAVPDKDGNEVALGYDVFTENNKLIYGEDNIYWEPPESFMIVTKTEDVQNMNTLNGFEKVIVKEIEEFTNNIKTIEKWKNIKNPNILLFNRPLSKGRTTFKNDKGEVLNSYNVAVPDKDNNEVAIGTNAYTNLSKLVFNEENKFFEPSDNIENEGY